MSEGVAIRERRTRQFDHYLGLMEHRTLEVVKSDCFVVFSVPAPPRNPAADRRLQNKNRAVCLHGQWILPRPPRYDADAG